MLKSKLIAAGIEHDRIFTVSYGEDKPPEGNIKALNNYVREALMRRVVVRWE